METLEHKFSTKLRCQVLRRLSRIILILVMMSRMTGIRLILRKSRSRLSIMMSHQNLKRINGKLQHLRKRKSNSLLLLSIMPLCLQMMFQVQLRVKIKVSNNQTTAKFLPMTFLARTLLQPLPSRHLLKTTCSWMA